MPGVHPDTSSHTVASKRLRTLELRRHRRRENHIAVCKVFLVLGRAGGTERRARMTSTRIRTKVRTVEMRAEYPRAGPALLANFSRQLEKSQNLIRARHRRCWHNTRSAMPSMCSNHSQERIDCAVHEIRPVATMDMQINIARCYIATVTVNRTGVWRNHYRGPRPNGLDGLAGNDYDSVRQDAIGEHDLSREHQRFARLGV